MSEVTILQGDALTMLRTLQDESFDCIVADPPYKETSLEWDRWVSGWPTEARRVLKRTGSMWVFGSMRMFMDRRDEFAGWRLSHDIVWEKQNGTSSFADRFRRVHESVCHFYRDDSDWSSVFKKPVYSLDATARAVRRKQRPQHWGEIGEAHYVSEDGGPRMMRSVIYQRNEHGRAEHPTQKPVQLVGVMIEYACQRGGSVLDLFSGSGTTTVAAGLYGCSATAIEINPQYIKTARRRAYTTLELSHDWNQGEL